VQIVDTPPRYARFRLPDGDATLSIEVDPAVSGTVPHLIQPCGSSVGGDVLSASERAGEYQLAGLYGVHVLG
jgi:hypothetical protein